MIKKKKIVTNDYYKRSENEWTSRIFLSRQKEWQFAQFQCSYIPVFSVDEARTSRHNGTAPCPLSPVPCPPHSRNLPIFPPSFLIPPSSLDVTSLKALISHDSIYRIRFVTHWVHEMICRCRRSGNVRSVPSDQGLSFFRTKSPFFRRFKFFQFIIVWWVKNCFPMIFRSMNDEKRRRKDPKPHSRKLRG